MRLSLPSPAPVLAALVGIAVFSLMDALMKRASLADGVYPALLLRSAIGTALMLPLWCGRGGVWPAPAALRLHLLRGTLVAMMAATFFWGLVRMPMAEGMALSFISPLIALGLAAWLLGERIRPGAIVGSALGLAGVSVIALGRLGESTHGTQAMAGIAAILFSAAIYAWNLILQRRQALAAGPVEVALFQNAVVCLVLLPFLPWLWAVPSRAGMTDAALAALCASAALMLLSWAYRRAETQALVTVEYTAFGWAALMGWLWFGEPVRPETFGGVVLIAIGCVLSARAPRGPAADIC